MRNVTIVVPVLMTSCQVSLKPKRGPLTAQRMTTPNATPNAPGLPATCAVHFANRPNQEVDLVAATESSLSGCMVTADAVPMLLKRNTTEENSPYLKDLYRQLKA